MVSIGNMDLRDNGDMVKEQRTWEIEDNEPVPPPLDMCSKEVIKVQRIVQVQKNTEDFFTIAVKEADKASVPTLKKKLSIGGNRSVNTFAPRARRPETKESGKYSFTSFQTHTSPAKTGTFTEKKWPKRPRQMPIEDLPEKEVIDDEWERNEYERKKKVSEQMMKRQKDNDRKKKKQRRLMNIRAKGKGNTNFDKLTTDSQGKVLLRRLINLDKITPKGATRVSCNHFTNKIF